MHTHIPTKSGMQVRSASCGYGTVGVWAWISRFNLWCGVIFAKAMWGCPLHDSYDYQVASCHSFSELWTYTPSCMGSWLPENHSWWWVGHNQCARKKKRGVLQRHVHKEERLPSFQFNGWNHDGCRIETTWSKLRAMFVFGWQAISTSVVKRRGCSAANFHFRFGWMLCWYMQFPSQFIPGWFQVNKSACPRWLLLDSGFDTEIWMPC